MKKTAKAPANIAFIKYWAKADAATRVPKNNSISMNLSDMYSICTVEFDASLKKNEVHFLDEETIKSQELARISDALDKIRNIAGSVLFAKVVTKNNFPKATGIASSASGFAALTLAATKALGLNLTEKELSLLARTFSGTACRSIPDGFVEWQKGTYENDSYALSLHPPEYWDIADVVAVVTSKMKKVSSTDGHALAPTSPFYELRLAGMDAKIANLKKHMRDKNFTSFGRIVEDEALNMHAICITSTPPLLYWQPETIRIMKNIALWRESGELESYFTIDAGSTVHVICRGTDAQKAKSYLEKIEGIEKVVINRPVKGAQLVTEHLF